MTVDKEYETYDKCFEEIEYHKEITLKLRCSSFVKENLDNIEDDIFEVINDKAFDGICYFEKL